MPYHLPDSVDVHACIDQRLYDRFACFVRAPVINPRSLAVFSESFRNRSVREIFIGHGENIAICAHTLRLLALSGFIDNMTSLSTENHPALSSFSFESILQLVHISPVPSRCLRDRNRVHDIPCSIDTFRDHVIRKILCPLIFLPGDICLVSIHLLSD